MAAREMPQSTAMLLLNLAEMRPDYRRMTVKQLRSECRVKRIVVSGPKATLVDRLETYDRITVEVRADILQVTSH